MNSDRFDNFADSEAELRHNPLNGRPYVRQDNLQDQENFRAIGLQVHELCAEFDRQMDGLLRQASRELKKK